MGHVSAVFTGSHLSSSSHTYDNTVDQSGTDGNRVGSFMIENRSSIRHAMTLLDETIEVVLESLAEVAEFTGVNCSSSLLTSTLYRNVHKESVDEKIWLRINNMIR
jgi:hypothetical protein